jgi:hypothetical protein
MANYIFMKVSDEQVVSADNEEEAVLLAVKKKLVDLANLKDYVVVEAMADGTFISGIIQVGINWP